MCEAYFHQDFSRERRQPIEQEQVTTIVCQCVSVCVASAGSCLWWMAAAARILAWQQQPFLQQPFWFKHKIELLLSDVLASSPTYSNDCTTQMPVPAHSALAAVHPCQPPAKAAPAAPTAPAPAWACCGEAQICATYPNKHCLLAWPTVALLRLQQILQNHLEIVNQKLNQCSSPPIYLSILQGRVCIGPIHWVKETCLNWQIFQLEVPLSQFMVLSCSSAGKLWQSRKGKSCCASSAAWQEANCSLTTCHTNLALLCFQYPAGFHAFLCCCAV